MITSPASPEGTLLRTSNTCPSDVSIPDPIGPPQSKHFHLCHLQPPFRSSLSSELAKAANDADTALKSTCLTSVESQPAGLLLDLCLR